jgi:hypothetical protein
VRRKNGGKEKCGEIGLTLGVDFIDDVFVAKNSLLIRVCSLFFAAMFLANEKN